MRTCKTLLCLLLSLALPVSLSAQQALPEVLTIEEAVSLTVAHNFDILTAANSTKLSARNVTLGNAGYLPRLSLSGGFTYTLADTKTEFANPEQPPIDAQGAATTNYDAGLNLSYTIFSGGSRKFTYQKLQNTAVQSGLRERQTIEQTVLSVLQQYLETVRLHSAWEINQQSVRISQDRYQRAKERYAFGGISKLELLNAEVDLSNDSTTMVQASLSFEKARKSLSNLMGVDPAASYTVSAVFAYDQSLVLEQLLEQAQEQNASYLLSKASLESSQLDVDLSGSAMLPRLDLQGGYSFNRTLYDANFLESTRSLGWNAGLSLSFDLFDGGNKRRERANARLQLESQEYQVQKAANDLQTSILNGYEDYQTNLQLITLSERSLDLAEHNYARSKEAFALGQITGIELREAQLNLNNAKYNLSVQRLQTKLAEVSLYASAGTLVE